MNEAESLVWESLFSPGKKRKKKVKSCLSKVLTQNSNNSTPRKKKKTTKFKEAMEKRKAKRKEKKKNKKDKLSKLLNSLENDFVDEPECVENVISENTTKEFKKKRKKQVAFDLPHDHLRVKRPKFSSSLLSPVHDSPAPVSTCQHDTEVSEATQNQAKNNDSQSTSEDMYSQDLFITQKTFRLPPSDLSSGETSDRAEDSTKMMRIHIRETKEQSVLFKTKKKKALYQGKTKSSPPNPFLDEPIVVTSSLDENKAKERAVNTQSMKSVYTQTENFFTTELTLYFNFCKKTQRQAESEELKPLDLCLPDRARRNNKTYNKDQHEEGSGKNVIEVSAGGCGELSMCAQRKEEQTPSSGSESDRKSADTTVSSEDAEGPSLSTRLEVMQVRAVQMRLNESFFFKTKGEDRLIRPESPLMKLVQGREPQEPLKRKT